MSLRWCERCSTRQQLSHPRFLVFIELFHYGVISRVEKCGHIPCEILPSPLPDAGYCLCHSYFIWSSVWQIFTTKSIKKHLTLFNPCVNLGLLTWMVGDVAVTPRFQAGQHSCGLPTAICVFNK